jgi:beta-phosphoglucomutase-like phosphatase (HAD superfamily)
MFAALQQSKERIWMLQFKNKQIDTAIFDMDGTMFDTERLRFKTLSQASEELFDKPFTEAVLMGSLGLSATKAEELAKQHYGDAFPYAAIRRSSPACCRCSSACAARD